MGDVYFAQHPRLPCREGLKTLSADASADDADRQRFSRKADVARPLGDSRIVRASDAGEFNRQLRISMDLVDGTDAATLLGDRYPVGVPADQVAAVIAAIAGALDYAHQQGDLIPGSCVHSGRAGPAGNSTWGVDHYPQLVR